MKTVLIFVLCTIVTALHSQSEPKAFEEWRTADGTQYFFHKNVTKTDGAGNIYLAGATTTTNGTTDILLSKKNSSGVTLWTRQVNGPANFHDFATAIYIDGSGNVFLTGAITNNTLTGFPDAVVIKYNSSGTQQFLSYYDGSGNMYDSGTDITLDGSGNIYIVGGSYNGSGNSDVLTAKFNSSGTLQWASTFDYANLNDGALKVAVSGSSVTVTGAVQTNSVSYAMGYLVYNTGTGSVTASAITSTYTTSADLITSGTTDASGNVYMTGAVPGGVQGLNYFTIKLNSSLAVLWTATYDRNNLDDISKSIKVDASGNVYVTGYSTGTNGRDYTTIKYNSSGTQQWIQHYNGDMNANDEAYDMEIDASANIYVTGYTSGDINKADYFTIKYNSSGTQQWTVQSDGFHLDDKATNIALDSMNNVIVTGEVENAPGSLLYGTIKYIQTDVITPTDYNGETPSSNFMYYANRGQLIGTNDTLVPDVKFYTQNTYPSFYFMDSRMSMVFSKVDTIIATTDTLHRIDMSLDNKRSASKIYPLEEQKEGYLNYYLAHTDSNGVTAVFGNKRLVAKDVYTNIDLMYSSNQNGIKYYFIVKPGGNPANIQMTFTGASSFSLNGTSNELSINSSIGSITFDRPTAYQLTSANATVAVTGWTPDWQTNGASNKYKFNLGAYTSSLTLIIEVDQGNTTNAGVPGANLCWSTYFGGQDDEDIFGVTKDAYGYQYIAGYTQSQHTNFPITTNAFQSILAAEMGGFYAKFNPNNGLIYSTYYSGGGPGFFTCFWDIKCKNNNEVVLAGYTTCNTMNLADPGGGTYFDNSFNSGSSQNGFIARFNILGNRTWASYLGSGSITAIDFDLNGNLYLAGYSASNFPLQTTPNYNQSYGGGVFDAFLMKLDNNYNLSWSTFIGGNSYDQINAIKVDQTNNTVYVTGSTESTDLPVYATGSAFYDNSLGGAVDHFAGAFSSSANRLWMTYLGGSSSEPNWYGGTNNINVDAGSVYIVGSTQSNDFPLLNPGGSSFFDNSLSVNTFPPPSRYGDGYITQFDKTTYQQKWGTLVSGNGTSSFNAVESDWNGNLFIAGSTGDHTIPLTYATGAYNQNTYPGGLLASTPDFAEDGIILNFNTPNRQLIWSTLLGGYNDNHRGDEIYDIVIHNSAIYLAGHTTDKSNSGTAAFPFVNPNTGNYFDNSFNGGHFDAFVARLCYTNLVGINELTSDNSTSIPIYPNPTTNILIANINGKNITGDLQIKIYNSIGQEVYMNDYKSVSNELEINTFNLASGLYFIKFINNKNTYTAKFIKQ